MGGLLFVVLQTTVFAVGSYLIFGIRGGQWRPSLFMMIPLIVLLYSYLFCVCVLIGVHDPVDDHGHPADGPVLVPVLGLNAAEAGLFAVKTMSGAQARGYEREVRQIDTDLARAERPARRP